MGYTATWAGFATAPMGILAVATSPIVGRLLPKVDPRWIVTYGMGILAVSFFMRAHLTTQADFMSVAIAMFVLGAGIPACMITLTSLGVSDLPPERIANGAGLQNFLRVLDGARIVPDPNLLGAYVEGKPVRACLNHQPECRA